MQAGEPDAIISKIASVTIKGTVLGTLAAFNNTDHFGFVAQQIGAMSVSGLKLPLTAAKNVIDPLGATGDVAVREV